ncbi:MAG: hypothetical protein E7530_03845 [Ruminococcaceae bacterium]|nr:hypothetical protein [Oscillospiraceae bacterium]
MKKLISLMLALIMALSVMSCLSLSVGAEYRDYYECDVAYTVEDGTGFWFYAEESGLYEFTSCNNYDPKLTIEFDNGDIIEYDDVDFDNLNYEFSAVIELEAGEEIFCFIEDGEGYDVDFYITRYYEELGAGEEYRFASGYKFKFIAEEAGEYEFTSFDNFDPSLTVEFEDGSVETYDDVDFDNFDYEFSAIIYLEAGEEIYCTVTDSEDYDINFYIEKYYMEVYAYEEYEMGTDYEFKFVAEEDATYKFYSFDNDDPCLTVEFEDGTIEYYDDISDDDYEFDAYISLDAGEEIICSVSDSLDYVNFGIYAYGNAYADVDYTADAGYEFFFTAEEEGFYRFVSFDNVSDPFIEILYDGEFIKFDDCCSEDYEFDGGLYLFEGDYVFCMVSDNYLTAEEDECVVNFCIEYWGEDCPGHYESEWYVDTEATVYEPGLIYMECELCGEIIACEEIPQLAPETPDLVSVANTTSGVKFTWSEVEGADSYIVYRRAYNTKTKKWGGWTRIADDVTATSYVDKTAKSGYYRYTVRAVNEGGTSGYDANGLKTYFLATPKVTSTANTNSAITVKWGKVTGATGYIVYRKTGNGKWQNLGKTTGTSFTDKTAKAGVTYRYTVRAYYGSYLSSFVANGYAVRRLTTPTLKSVTSSKSGVTFNWNKVAGATGYNVYRKTGNGGWQKIATVKGTSTVKYLDKTAKKGVTYKYTVRAYYGTSTSYYNTKGLTIKDKY